MEPKNIMEEITKKLLLDYLPFLDLSCTCERCLNDILALSLNQLPPHYIMSRENAVYVRAKLLEKQNYTNILSIIIKSAIVVSENPRCKQKKANIIPFQQN